MLTPLESALALADLGIKVFPLWGVSNARCNCQDPNCASPGKHPALSEWQTSASNNKDAITRWSSYHRDCNFGVPVGPINELVVIDVHHPTIDKDATPKELTEDTRQSFRDTYHTKTASGTHYFFRLPEASLIYTTTSELFQGVNFHSAGSYVVAPGSRHASGSTYGREAPLPLSIDAFKALPAQIEKIFIERSISSTVFAEENKVSEGGRAELLFREGVKHHRKFKEGTNGVFRMLSKLNLTVCSPPIEERQLRRLVASVVDHCEKLPPALDGQAQYTDVGTGTGRKAIPATARTLLTLLTQDDQLMGLVCYEPGSSRIAFGQSWLDRNQRNQEEPLPATGESSLQSIIAPVIVPQEGVLPGEFGNTFWSDVNTNQLAIHFEGILNTPVKKEALYTALTVAAEKNKGDRYADFLNELEWDGTPRIDEAIRKIYKIPNEVDLLTGTTTLQRTEYVAFLGKNIWLAHAQRTLFPGSKHDIMPVLIGRQGVGKSLSLRVLFGETNVINAPSEVLTRYFFMTIEGKRVIEMSELVSFNASDLGKIKECLSSTTFTYTSNHAKFSKDVPRIDIFVGTTNDMRFLKDNTGERRFAPIVVEGFDIEYAKANRLQLLAEAVRRVKNKEKFYALPDFMDKIHAAHKVEFIWEPLVYDYIQGKDMVRAIDIVTNALRNLKHPPTDKQIGISLRKVGWESRIYGTNRLSHWFPPGSDRPGRGCPKTSKDDNEDEVTFD